MTIAPYIGVDAVTQDSLISLVVAGIFFILSYFDAKYPNTILEKQPTCDDAVTWEIKSNMSKETAEKIAKILEEDNVGETDGGEEGA